MNRRLRSGSASLVLSALVLAALVLLNVVASKGTQTWDLTHSGLNTLAPQSVLAAKRLNADLLVIGLFRSTVGSLIEKVRGSVANGHPGKVRLFGEMVSQLRGSNLKATTRLEELWNQVIEKHSVSLLCTYALQGQDDHIPQGLLDLHSQNIERESVA